MTFVLALSLLTTCVTLIGLYLQGAPRTRVWGFSLGIVNQLLWAALAIQTGAYGLLFTCPIYAALYLRSIRNELRERQRLAALIAQLN